VRSLAAVLAAALIVVFANVAGAAPGAAAMPLYDVILSGGHVVDGTGAPWRAADVAILGDRVAAIGDLGAARARRRIDVHGMVVAPGFIDMLGQSEYFLLVDGRAASKVMQGVTTEITGEGGSIAPVNARMIQDDSTMYAHYKVWPDWTTLAEYFARLERARPAINLGTFVGAGGVRNYVIGKTDRPATSAELAQMKRLVAQAMDQGALGLSSALQYVPDRFASTAELVELAKEAAKRGGIYITHQRSEGDRLMQSLDEVFTIAAQAHIPAEIFHLKAAFRSNWGQMPEVLRRIEQARARGLDITANQYPYTRAANGLDACLPIWVRAGGTDSMIARLHDPALRERIRRDMDDPHPSGWENQWAGSGGADGVMLASAIHPSLKPYQGMTLAAIGKKLGQDPRDVVMDFVARDRAESGVIISIMNEDDVRAALAHPFISVGTDYPEQAEDGPLSEFSSHPRAWGSFPRILGRYVRDEHLLRLEEAVRKMTSLPAARVGLVDRGTLRPGAFADVTVFDPATIRDVSTFESPRHYATGVRYVFVNGNAVVAEGRLTAERPGRVLRGPGYRPDGSASR
jgi:N-acyl-D-amino-acid deacylase